MHLPTYTGLQARCRLARLSAARSPLLAMFVFFLSLAMPGTSAAQSTGVLYEPEPPADAAYVRIVHLNPNEKIDVLVDGKMRQSGLKQGQFGDYLILRSGPHEIQLQAHQASKKITASRLEVGAAQVVTLAFVDMQKQVKPIVFDDKADLNRMKARLTVYHLADKLGPVNISTADGKTNVFRALAPSSSHSLAVNPIKVELLTCPSANQPAGMGECSSPALQQARAALVLERGDNYSLLLTMDANSALQARFTKNTLESRAAK